MRRLKIALLFNIIVMLAMGGTVWAERDALSILLLHSYNIDFKWTKDQHEGFLETLEANGIVGTYSIEFMDTKKYPKLLDDTYYLEALKSKYMNKTFDYIYVTDNDALTFITKYKEELFPDVPLIASGINYGTDLSAVPPDTHIIIEQSDAEKTIELMLSVQPQIQRIHVLVDQSATGHIHKAYLESVVMPKFPSLEFIWVDGLSLKAMPAYFSVLDQSDGVMLAIYFTDGKDETYTEKEIPTLVATHSPVPVWCNWDFHMNSGVIGGSLISGRRQGISAGETMVALINHNERPMVIDETLTGSQTTIDYQAMQRHHIKAVSFPDGVLYLNKPVNYFVQNRLLILVASGIILVLLSVIWILTRLNRDQKMIQLKSNELLMMKTAIISNQTEIVFRIAEMIETRSHDTGNHVRRVALISRVLGAKQGLDTDALRVLETAAAMHDVGKIGIPEHILSKPGPLNAEERLIMNTHTSLGHKVFGNSDLPIFQKAAIIAHEHHEYWDGSGYPLGLCGEEIHLYARIVAIADVFDALLSKRTYKEPWTVEATLGFFTAQKSKMFDPNLVESLLEMMDEILEIRELYQD